MGSCQYKLQHILMTRTSNIMEHKRATITAVSEKHVLMLLYNYWIY